MSTISTDGKKGLSQRCSVDKFNFFYILKDVDTADIKKRRAELKKIKEGLEKQLQKKREERKRKACLACNNQQIKIQMIQTATVKQIAKMRKSSTICCQF